MTLVLMPLSDCEKLDTLRRLDRFRSWASLNEARFCLVCERLIAGRDILVIREADEPDSAHLACPTGNCASIPMDWILPTEEILTALAMREEGEPLNERRSASGPPREEMQEQV